MKNERNVQQVANTVARLSYADIRCDSIQDLKVTNTKQSVILSVNYKKISRVEISPANPAHPDEKIMTGGACIQIDNQRTHKQRKQK